MGTDAALLLEGLADDVACVADDIEGTIPEGLRGTLLRNGPGLLTVGSDDFAMLDGYGAVAALCFDEGRVVFRNHLVQSRELTAERAAGRMLRRRPFTNLPSRWKNLFNIDFGNSASHDAFAYDGRIYAADTFGWYALDGATLETRGPETLNGAVRGDVQVAPMPRVDPASGRLVAYTLQPGKISVDVVTFRELSSGLREARAVPFRLPGMGNLLHDLAFSENHYVVIRWGQLSAPRVLGGGATLWNCVDFDGEKTPRLFVVPRDGSDGAFGVPLPGQLAFHIFNAFEQDGKLIVDTTSLPDRPSFSATYPPSLRERYKMAVTETPPPRIRRHTIDLASRTLASTVVGEVVGDAPEIDERFHGRPHRFGFVAAKTTPGDEADPSGYFFFHGLARVDFETGQIATWDAGPRQFCSPPAFVPRSPQAPEGDGWVLAWVLDCAAGRTDVVVLDAADLPAGPVARVHLRSRLGAVSHTRFEPAVRLSV